MCLRRAQNVNVMKSQTSVGKRPSRLSQGSQVSMRRCECQSGEKFKPTRVNGGSIYDSLKVTSSECQSNGNPKRAWVNGGSIYDSPKVASALTVTRCISRPHSFSITSMRWSWRPSWWWARLTWRSRRSRRFRRSTWSKRNIRIIKDFWRRRRT